MSPLLLFAIIAGQVALGGAALALSRVVQTLQVDARQPGTIIDRPDRRAPMVTPPELERVERLVADAMASEPVAASQLRPILAELGRAAPGGRVSVPAPPRDRRRWLATSLVELERAWGIGDGPGSKR